LAAASTTGCIAVGPAAVMLPATQLTAAADAGADAASLAAAALGGAAVGAVVAAADGAVLAPLLEHAPTASAAISANAPRRLGVEMVTDPILLVAARPRASRAFGTVLSVLTPPRSPERMNARFVRGQRFVNERR